MKKQNGSLIGVIREFIDGIDRRRGFCGVDAAVLKTAMMLAAVDGQVGVAEMAFFRRLAETCRGFNEHAFEDLWEKALHSAGYLFLQSRLMGKDKLVDAFLREAEGDFLKEIALEPSEERERAFACLEKMAEADGDYSEIERVCIQSLSKMVGELRRLALASHFSRAKHFD